MWGPWDTTPSKINPKFKKLTVMKFEFGYITVMECKIKGLGVLCGESTYGGCKYIPGSVLTH
jgi:hypothetical protein